MKKDPASKYFTKEINDKERAIFEAGIKLGAIYHQLIGLPIPRDKTSVSLLVKSLQDSFKTQPYVENLAININQTGCISTKPYDYKEINGKLLNINLTIRYGKARVKATLKYIEEINYPLAYITSIELLENY